MSDTTGARDEFAAVILDHLKQAAEAHGIHETVDLSGVRDEQWPEWYAQHMATTLREAGYRLERAD
ncbi:hypothetical protein AB4Z18_00460 [Leifsonia sp. 2TAF2]|uniref:hypothetical protein n=1 Tax=Leifsonia sp. 2TAF2 TaxID=3233009 RepID=UPI003F980692